MRAASSPVLDSICFLRFLLLFSTFLICSGQIGALRLVSFPKKFSGKKNERYQGGNWLSIFKVHWVQYCSCGGSIHGLCSLHTLLHKAHCTLYCTKHTTHWIKHTAHTSQRTEHTTHCTIFLLHTSHCTVMITARYTLYKVNCTLFWAIHFTFWEETSHLDPDWLAAKLFFGLFPSIPHLIMHIWCVCLSLFLSVLRAEVFIVFIFCY